MEKYKESDFIWCSPRKTNGKNMIDARAAAGLSQQELAEKVGVKARQVQRWEKGTSKPSPASLEKLDALFGMDWTNAPEP
ncbi:MAG: helix-turn-helix transcriptional regulator [Clostridia bacterium]|nr:helix-turn-helix transcriptional regulator [Clostridia bacterium]